MGLVLVGVVFSFKKGSADAAYDEQLAELLEDDNYESSDAKLGFSHKWNRHWGALFKEMGLARYNDANEKAGREVLIGAFVIAVLGSLIAQNLFIGPAIVAALLFGSSILLKSLGEKKAEKINDQLPGFLFALKANIQANETPERAIIKVIDAMPSPLYDDLVIVKNHIDANSSFKDALLDLSQKTASRDLKFLCACIIQAANSGSDLEDQIVIIQKVLEDRKKVSDKIAEASRSAAPAIWVASIAIPATFFIIFSADPNAASFWFINPVSWIALGVIITLWIVGIYLARKMVSNIKNL